MAALKEGDRTIIEITLEQAEKHFCANVLQVRSEKDK
jgi:hypothetical protein